jgi:hypothetical protein
MKKLLIGFVALACATLIPISTAQAYCAGQTRQVNRCGCGASVYQRWQVVGYERDGCPRYGWATLPHQCIRHSSHHHGSSHGHSSHKKKYRHGDHYHSSREMRDRCPR